MGVVYPQRAPESERDGHQPLAEAGDVLEPDLDLLEELLIGGGWAVENRHGTDVHVGVRPLQVKEELVEDSQALGFSHAVDGNAAFRVAACPAARRDWPG
jgi:hypothetical protein